MNGLLTRTRLASQDLVNIAWMGDVDRLRRCSSDARFWRRSAPVSMPRACIFVVVFGPTPWNFATGRVATKASAWSGMIANWPFGLRVSDAILARNLLQEIPAEAVSVVSS